MAKDWFPQGWFPQGARQVGGGGGTPTPTPTPAEVAGPPAVSSYEVHIDWNGDGDFSDDNEDVTTDVLQMSWRRGRNRANQLVGKSVAGRAKVYMRSPEGKYFPGQGASPLAGSVLPARDIRILMLVPIDSLSEHDRPSKASYIDSNGYLQFAASEELRGGHYIDGEPHILLEDSGENVVDGWNLLGWNRSATGVQAEAEVSPGFIPYNLHGNGGAYAEDSGLNLTTGVRCLSVCVKQGTSDGAVICLQRGSNVEMAGNVGPWTDGEPDVTAPIGSFLEKIELADGWWLLRFQTNSLIISSAWRFRVYPNGTSSNSNDRSILIMAPQLEDQPLPTSLMDPGTAREEDSLYYPFRIEPQAMTLYAKVRGGVTESGDRVLQIGQAGGQAPRLQIERTGTGFKVTHANGTSTVDSEAAALPDFGEYAEVRVVLSGDGAVRLHVTIDDTTTSGTKSAALDFAESWSDSRLWLNSVGLTNIGSQSFADVKIVLGTDRPLVEMQNLGIEGSDEIVLVQQIMWYGQLDNIQPDPKYHGHHRITLTALGPMKLLTEREVNIPLVQNTASGDIVSEILDQSEWPMHRRDIEDGTTQFATFFTRGSAFAYSALLDVEETEFGWVGETRTGSIFFQGRHHRLQGNQLNISATFRDTYEEDAIRILEPKQLDYLDNVFNVVRVPYRTWTPGTLATLWTHPDTLGSGSIQVAASGTFVVWAQYPGQSSPTEHIGVHTWTTPVAATDYQVGSGSQNSDLTVTVEKFSRRMKITITNTTTTEVDITTLQARGTPLVESDVAEIITEDTESQDKYGSRDYPFPGEFVSSVNEANDFASAILSIYKDPVPSLIIPWLASRDIHHLLTAAQLDLSDRVAVALTGVSSLGLNEDMFIENESHTVVQASREHRVVYEMSFATDFGGFWTLGTSALGTDTKLGY